MTRPPGTTASRASEVFDLGYRPALDGLRAVAIIAVLVFHAGIATTVPSHPNAVDHLAGIIVFHGRQGDLGVVIFFVLSGFLITRLLVQEQQRIGSISLRSFYWRRVLRLFPAVMFLVAVCGGYVLARPAAPESQGFVKDSLGTLFYFANWRAMLHPSFLSHLLSHTWSLSIEEQFYLLWPPVLLLLFRLRIKMTSVALGLIATASASAVARALLWASGASVSRVYYGLDTRGDALLLGCALGILVVARVSPTSPGGARLIAATGLGGAAILGLLLFNSGRYARVVAHGAFYWVFPLAAAASAGVIFAVVLRPDGMLARCLGVAPAVWVGRLSYSLYLWHFPVFIFLTPDRTHLSPALLLSLRLAAAFGAAAFSFYLVERPFLALKRRLERERATGARPNSAMTAPSQLG